MSKIHSKINSARIISLSGIVVSIIFIILQILFTARAIIASRKEPKQIQDPVKLQQQNIQKAYELMSSQTVVKN